MAHMMEPTVMKSRLESRSLSPCEAPNCHRIIKAKHCRRGDDSLRQLPTRSQRQKRTGHEQRETLLARLHGLQR